MFLAGEDFKGATRFHCGWGHNRCDITVAVGYGFGAWDNWVIQRRLGSCFWPRVGGRLEVEGSERFVKIQIHWRSLDLPRGWCQGCGLGSLVRHARGSICLVPMQGKISKNVAKSSSVLHKKRISTGIISLYPITFRRILTGHMCHAGGSSPHFPPGWPCPLTIPCTFWIPSGNFT